MNIRELAGMQIDEFELVNLIGEGGMSAVYRAYQEELDRYVAMKILSEQLAKDPDYMTRFQQEAKMAASLEHPHIVPVYDFGIHQAMSFVVMRLLNHTLTDRLTASTPMILNDLIVMMEQIARALDYAHSRGIVHRDVKPSNIMFDESRTAYLVDFGIAKATQAETGLTAEHMVLGTPSYMSPEQWRGEGISSGSDQYAFAIVIFQALTGQLPFRADTPSQLMYKHLHDAPPSANTINPNLSPAVADVLNRAMDKNAARRYPLMSNFVNALKQTLTERTVSPPVISPQTTQVHQKVPVPDRMQQEPVQATMQNPKLAQSQAHQPMMLAQQNRPVAAQGNTILMQVARGGVLGIGLIFALIIIAILVVLFLFAPNPEPQDISSNDGQSAPATINNEDNNAPEIVVTNRREPTQSINISIESALTPVGFIGMDATRLSSVQTLLQRGPVPVRDAIFSPNAVMMASAHGDGMIRLWREGASGNPLVLAGHTDVVSALAFHPNGSILASVGRDATVRLWDTATGQAIALLNGHTGSVRDVVFSPDGTLLASVSEDGTVRLWDIASGQLQRSINVDNTRALTVAFSTDGSLIASGGSSGQVRLWRVSDGVNIRNLEAHSEEIRSLDFSPNGTLLASSSTDNTVILWRFETGETIHILNAQRDVFVVKFNPDGTLLATGTRDNNIRLWNVASGTELKLLTGHTGWILGLDFSPDGSSLISGSGDGSVRLWR
jgi:serine/threonine protein kinase